MKLLVSIHTFDFFDTQHPAYENLKHPWDVWNGIECI
jgi:hypothetical protein